MEKKKKNEMDQNKEIYTEKWFKQISTNVML